MKTTCTLYGQGDDTQSVQIEYDGDYQAGRFIVSELKVLTPITIDCGDAHADLEAGIVQDLGLAIWQVEIRCVIENAADKKMARLAQMNPDCQFLPVAV